MMLTVKSQAITRLPSHVYPECVGSNLPALAYPGILELCKNTIRWEASKSYQNLNKMLNHNMVLFD